MGTPPLEICGWVIGNGANEDDAGSGRATHQHETESSMKEGSSQLPNGMQKGREGMRKTTFLLFVLTFMAKELGIGQFSITAGVDKDSRRLLKAGDVMSFQPPLIDIFARFPSYELHRRMFFEGKKMEMSAEEPYLGRWVHGEQHDVGNKHAGSSINARQSRLSAHRKLIALLIVSCKALQRIVGWQQVDGFLDVALGPAYEGWGTLRFSKLPV